MTKTEYSHEIFKTAFPIYKHILSML